MNTKKIKDFLVFNFQKRRKLNKKANVLHEQIIFIILNVVFFSIIILFIYLQSSPVHLAEEETAKQIALLIDSSKPSSEIQVNLADFFEKAEGNGISKKNSINIDNDNNLVVVKGREDSFYEYSYFNDVDVEYNFKEGYLVLVIK